MSVLDRMRTSKLITTFLPSALQLPITGSFAAHPQAKQHRKGRTMRTLTLCPALSCLAFTALAQRAPKPARPLNRGAGIPRKILDQYEAREFNGMPYRFLLPEDYDPAQKYPLILSLHGGAGRGNDNESQMRHWTENFTNAAWRTKYPCVVIAPQSKDFWSITGDGTPTFTDAELAELPEVWQSFLKGRSLPTEPVKDGSLTKAFALTDRICEDYNIDKKRIYVLGHSGGGFGTWHALWAAPERFAAAIPSAGGMVPWKDPAKFKDVPIWTFHGNADKVVPVDFTRTIYARIKEVGGNMKYSELKKVGHNASNWAFSLEDEKGAKGYSTQCASERCDRTALVWEWLFAQELK